MVIIIELIKNIIKKIPVLGPASVQFAKYIGYKQVKPKIYIFERYPIPKNLTNEKDVALLQIKNLLNYSKTSGTFYAAINFPAGYHTLNILGEHLNGRRNPKKRFENIPYDFNGKTVLDIGSNQGGMLFELSGCIRWGIGLDYDPKMINVSNRIKELEQYNNLQFYFFDLENDPLELIQDFLPSLQVDIVFLLSVCRWIKNWRLVIHQISKISNTLLIETNGNEEQQAEQKAIIELIYNDIVQLSFSSNDDPERNDRKLFLCR